MYKNLKAEMKKRRIKQNDIARVLNLSRQSLSYKMRGKRDFKKSEMEQIKRFLAVEMPLDELFKNEAKD